MANYVIKGVEILYPRINRTYRFDQVENRSIPCGPFEDGARYETSFRMTSEQAKALMVDMAQCYAERQQGESKWPEKFPMPFKKDDDGMYTGKATLKGAYGEEATNAPRQFDSANKELPKDFLLTTGSIANVAVDLVPYNMADAGVSLRVRAVQIIKYVPMEVQSPFESVEGFVAEIAETGEEIFASPADTEKVKKVAKEKPVKEPKKVVKLKSSPPPKEEENDLSAIVDGWDD